jgi:L-arginine dehydrogenase
MTNHPIVLDAEAVAKLLPQVDVLQELRDLFVELGKNQAVQPPQTLALLPEDKGDFITYLGGQTGAGVFGAKLSPYLVTGSAPIITAWTFLMSVETGQPLLLCDSGALTTERTAATTALAVDLLAGIEANNLAIIGSSAVAKAHWRHVAGLRTWEKVTVYSSNLANNANNRAEWCALCPDVIFAESAEVAADGADVVMLCTSSGTPVLDASAIGSSTLVTSISTNVAQAHEITPEFLNTAQVYCDYKKTTPSSAGDMVLAAKNHGWDANEIKGDLAELTTDVCALPETGAPVYFRSIGLGLEDIAIANAIYRAANAG